MHLDFDEIKATQESGGGSQWTSYSDLFMVLSCVFLILYVVASFRSGTIAISSNLKVLKANDRIKELNEELTIYERDKNDYMQKNASEKDKKLYEDVMQHIVLLEGEASKEKERLAMLSEEQAKREKELNRYQKIIKNVIEANLASKEKIIKQEEIIKQRENDISTLNNIVKEKEFTIQEKEKKIETNQSLLAKQQAKTQDLLEDKEQIEKELSNKINKEELRSAMLNETLQERDSVIKKKEEKISTSTERLKKTHQQLERQKKTVEEAEKAKKQIKEEIKRQVEKVRQEAEKELEQLTEQKKEIQSNLKMAQLRIKEQEEEQAELSRKLKESKEAYDEKNQALKATEDSYQQKILEVQQLNDEKMKELEKQHIKRIEEEKMTAANKIQAEREYQEKIEKEKREFEKRLAGLKKDLSKAKKKTEKVKQKYNEKVKKLKAESDLLNDMLQESNKRERTLGEKLDNKETQLDSLGDELQQTKLEASDLQHDLIQAKKTIASQRKELAERISDYFRRGGVEAEVDMESGDVTIQFGDEYFDTDKSVLKPGMKEILNKAIPAYAESLFGDHRIAKRIEAIEIIGFASPTYDGKLINPASLKPEDRTAVNYNMDLSYKRAKSIFEYIFDPSKLRYKHQKAFLPLLKVTGKSYLSEEIKADMGSMTREEYCAKYDCKKSQKVIIKFNLEN